MNATVDGSRILLVDDHPDTLRATAKLLRSAGHEVHVATSAEEALEVAETGCCSILISDVGLPDRSGHELMRELANRYGYKGIAVTGHSGTGDERASKTAGFAKHLVKPIRFNDLLTAIRELAA
jgi:CheY-like chemotaxis protein